MCQLSKCLCDFPTVGTENRYAHLVQPYVESLPAETICAVKLFDKLLKKLYPESYDGLYFDKHEGKYPCIMLVINQKDFHIKSKITYSDGKMVSTWKVFKRSLDIQLASTVSCGICLEEWKTGADNVPSFWGCSTCANTVCSACMKGIEDNCPYCRSSMF